MSIIEQIPSVTYKGNGTQTQFEFPFPILAEENLSVSIFNTIDKTTTKLELGTDYDVVVENNEYPAENGYIIYMYKPTGEGLPAGLNLTIDRAVPYEQQSVYPPNTLLNPEQIEDDLDNLEMQIQQLKLKDGRLITIPPGYEGTTEDYLEEFWDAVQNGGEQALNAADRAEDAADRAEDAADEAEAWAKEQGLWEMDDNNDLFPIENTPITADDDWELDENGDIMPRGTVESLQYPTHVRVVDVFSKLQGLNLKTGQLVMTQGFYEPADGGGASYVCVDSLNEDETADGYGIIALNNGKFLKLQIQDYINVKWFGARGNGITDDTVAIQTGLDFAFSNQITKTLFVPQGRYVVTDTIVIEDFNTRGNNAPFIKGEGRQFTVFEPKNMTNDNVVFDVRGTSGVFNDVGGCGFSILCDNTSIGNNPIGIRLLGTGFSKWYDLKLQYCSIGFMLSTDREASFTEVNRISDTEIQYCNTSVKLEKGVGSGSFHGNVFELWTNSHEGQTVFSFGSATIVYNCRFILNVWLNAPATIFDINSNNNSRWNFFDVRIETNSTNAIISGDGRLWGFGHFSGLNNSGTKTNIIDDKTSQNKVVFACSDFCTGSYARLKAFDYITAGCFSTLWSPSSSMDFFVGSQRILGLRTDRVVGTFGQTFSGTFNAASTTNTINIGTINYNSSTILLITLVLDTDGTFYTRLLFTGIFDNTAISNPVQIAKVREYNGIPSLIPTLSLSINTAGNLSMSHNIPKNGTYTIRVVGIGNV